LKSDALSAGGVSFTPREFCFKDNDEGGVYASHASCLYPLRECDRSAGAQQLFVTGLDKV
jgi:hypothetical protein